MFNNDYLALYWKYDENRKKFFEKFAKNHKFDPLLAENWYNISALEVKKAMVCE